MSSDGKVKSGKMFKVLDMVYIAIGAVLIVICSWINIPTAVPFTLQTFAVFFILMLLGGELDKYTDSRSFHASDIRGIFYINASWRRTGNNFNPDLYTAWCNRSTCICGF